MKLSLELGGNAPFLVFDDADLDKAVAGAILCKFRNAGQICISANRLLVQDGIHDAFVARYRRRSPRCASGRHREGVNVGPLIDQQGVEKVGAHVQDAPREGRRGAARRRTARARRAVLRADGADRRHRRHGDVAGGDVRPGRAASAASATRRRASASPTTLHTGSPRTSTAATSGASGASARGSSTASSASTPASCPPRWRRSAA